MDTILGTRPVDLAFNKVAAKLKYNKPIKYYQTFLEKVKKEGFKHKVPFLLEMTHPLTICQRKALPTLLEFARKSAQKEGSVCVTSAKSGTGKSYLCKYFVSYLDQNKIPYAISCYTAAAAVVYDNASTIHSLLNIFQYKLPHSEMVNLPMSSFNRKRIKECSIFIVDEYSLVSASFLAMVVKRICKIKNIETPNFGIWLIGDSKQIPPVAALALWSPIVDGMDQLTLYGLQLFQNAEFKTTLETACRSAQDQTFSRILDNYHSGNLTEADCSELEKRRSIYLCAEEQDNFSHSVHLFSSNQMCYLHCQKYFAKSELPVLVLEPILNPQCDFCKSTYYPLILQVGAAYIITRNYSPSRGIYNGACGILLDVYFKSELDVLPTFVVLRVDGYTGVYLEGSEKGVPIPLSVEKIKCAHQNIFVTVQRFELLSNNATTHIRSQGSTRSSIVVSTHNLSFRDPRLYTGISRVRRLDDLMILSDKPVSHFLLK